MSVVDHLKIENRVLKAELTRANAINKDLEDEIMRLKGELKTVYESIERFVAEKGGAHHAESDKSTKQKT